ncbi:hypothetical protein P3X46_018376 [Hevea brasiliensis]|uniref:FAD-binding domain-containing protein n=1 Tax=Hevea brasiliensis TaxID=3981 RepID=A0ABQ9LQH6_HEVBR|nr:hypothetical protein P3X46_018376 [Hevea brasiliensis]
MWWSVVALAGLATGVAFKRVGVQALILERSETLRTTGAALGLLPNAWLALDALGISHKLTSRYAPSLSFNPHIIIWGFVTNVAAGAVQEIFYSEAEGKEPRTVHRKALLEALAQELPDDSIRFSSKLNAIEKQELGGDSIIVVLIGCDGVHSVVANWLALSAPVYSGRSAARGLAIFPQGHGLRQEVNQFVDAGKRADPELIQKQVIEKYAENFPSQYLEVVRHSDLSTLTWAPLMLRHPWNVVFGNLSKGNITVAGDAMHPMTPDLAQGGCSALEDAVVLGRHIGNSFIKNGGLLVPEDVATALDAYVKDRRWRAAMLITRSYLSGWVQQDAILYGLVFTKVFNAVHYDCGTLPSISASGELQFSSKKSD